MKIPIYQVDAFTSKIFEGNPAAVCPLKQWISEDIMQNIAQENNLSETAFFVKKDNNFEIRWFTPVAELDLAGHPTLASAHVIYLMDFPSRDPRVDKNIDQVAEALGSRPKKLYRHRDAVAIFDNEDEIKNIYPNMDKLKNLDYSSVIVTAKGNKIDFVSRNFAPKLGIPEDPVTGSAHCELIPYWSKTLNKKELLAHQISKRGGKLYCTHNGDRVTIGGEAITFLRGEIEI
jgi:predicted PhzF superfamily epimerase YddE/YHI9